MYAIIKKMLWMLVPGILFGCDIRDKYDNCGIYLEFIFDYNMEYANSFNPQVKSVDVYIFDNQGYYLFSKHTDSETSLINENQMYLSDEIPLGIYQLITIGNLSEYFSFTDATGKEFISGVTTIEEVQLALMRKTGEISHAFPHIWFAKATQIDYKANLSVWPVHLIRNTNYFNILIQNKQHTNGQQTGKKSPYTFEIITPEGAVYGYDNNPLIKEKVIYYPYFLEPGDNPEDISAGKLNTMRLFSNNPNGYQFIIRNATTLKEVWRYDLIKLLEKTKPSFRSDGTPLPLQEYLDRQGEWNMVILYKEEIPGVDDSFIAVSIKVNGWIIWLNDLEI